MSKFSQRIRYPRSCHLYVIWISGNGWKERYITDEFIEDYAAMAWFDHLGEVYKAHPDDLCWDVHSVTLEIGNPVNGSDPMPARLVALVEEFGLDNFLALPEVRMIDSNSFEYEIPE